VPKPGDSPFKQPQGAAMATLVAQTVAMLLVLALSLPFLVPGVIAIVADLPVLGWGTLAVGVVVGAVVLVLGVRWGARTYDRRAPELLQRVLSYA